MGLFLTPASRTRVRLRMLAGPGSVAPSRASLASRKRSTSLGATGRSASRLSSKRRSLSACLSACLSALLPPCGGAPGIAPELPRLPSPRTTVPGSDCPALAGCGAGDSGARGAASVCPCDTPKRRTSTARMRRKAELNSCRACLFLWPPGRLMLFKSRVRISRK